MSALAEDQAGKSQFLVFAHDEESFKKCMDACNKKCVLGRSKALGKFTLPLVLLNHGYDVVYLDFDTYLFKNPRPVLRQF